MKATGKPDVWEALFGHVRRSAEANWQWQQSMLQHWYGLWPRSFDPETVRRQWSDSLTGFLRVQEQALQSQLQATVDSFRAVVGSAEAIASEAGGVTLREKAPETTARQTPESARRDEPQATKKSWGGNTMNIQQKVAIITGAASGIGEAVARQLAERGARTVVLVDRSDRVLELAGAINQSSGRPVAVAQIGDATDSAFRTRVFQETIAQHGMVSIVVPAAGITRDALAVRVDKNTGKAEIYPVDTFRAVVEVNLLAPVYWALEMVAHIAEDRRRRGLGRWEPAEEMQGTVVFLGSVSSQGNKGQIAYAVTKAGLEGAAATLSKEAIFHGVRCAIIHPGFTDTPMVRALGEEYVAKNVLPYTQLRRLIRPEEIADAICFMVSNSAVSGELWADAGWHPPA